MAVSLTKREELVTKKLHDLAVLYPLVHAHFMVVNKICRDAAAPTYEKLPIFQSTNRPAVICAVRQALFKYHKLSDPILLKIIAKDIKRMVVEARIDVGDEYVVVQADDIQKKNDINIVFELHAFRRYLARQCSNRQCQKREISPNKLFDRCGSCNLTSYCSRACQVQHWKMGHKNLCTEHKSLVATSILCLITWTAYILLVSIDQQLFKKTSNDFERK